MPARSAAISSSRGRLSAICQVPCPTTGTSSGIGPNASLCSSVMRYIGSMAIESVNPATGERLRAFEPDAPAAVEAKLARGRGRVQELEPAARRRARARCCARAGEILEAEKRGVRGRR